MTLPDLEVAFSEWSAKVAASFSPEDRDLAAWIEALDDEDVEAFLSNLASRWNVDGMTYYWLKSRGRRVTAIEERQSASRIVVSELRQYGGNSLIFWSKPHYSQVLARVHERLAKRVKKKAPQVASVQFREEAIASLLVAEALSSLSEDEVREALSGSDLRGWEESRKQILLETLAATGVQGLARLLGKRVIKTTVLKVVEVAVQKKVGVEAAREVLARVAAKIPQETFKRALFWIGVALMVKDIYDIAGEATRVTTPLVANISILRSVQRAGEHT